jgi:hypothetical protein
MSNHPLPLTRQWCADYRKYGNGPKPEKPGNDPFASFRDWLLDNPPPNLLDPSLSWENYDRQMAHWQRRRRER